MGRRRSHPRSTALIAIVASFCPVAALGTESAPSANGATSVHLTVAFTESAFLGVNRVDVAAGYKVLAQNVGRRRGYEVISTIQAFKDSADLDELFRDETVRLLVMNAWVFMDTDTRRMTPMFVGSFDMGVGRNYALVTRRDSGLNTLTDLRGKNLLVFELANTTLGRFWIETLVAKDGMGDANAYFASTTYVRRPASAVLPVFFGNEPACVVDLRGLELMMEMNPQLGRELQVIARSELLVDTVICLRNESWPEGSFREDLIATLGDFHSEPAGAQILTIFKVDRLVPFREEDLAATRALRRAYDRAQELKGR